MTNTTFRLARNPDADSTLPYLLWVPHGSTPLVLEAKDTWPRTAKVHCHRGQWPDDAEIVEETPVRSCARRGVAIDLGDYAVEVDGETVGVVERKKLAELAGNVYRFEL